MTSSKIGPEIITGQMIEILKLVRLLGLYIIGATGTGKTCLLENLIVQDIEQDLGVCVVEPHGDVIQAVLARIPDRREQEVIYLDLADDGSVYVFTHHVKEDFTHNFIGFWDTARLFGAPALLADPQRVQAFIMKYGTRRVADSVARGHTVYPGQAFVKLLFSLRQTMVILAREPILVATGQHEPIYDRPRTFADMQAEIASKLATLPNFTAVTRIAAENRTVEYTIRTLAPERGLGKAALQARIERIQAHNRHQGYTRSRQTVEAEIRHRQAQCSHLPPLPGQQPPKPPAEEPPISRQQPL